MRSAGGEGKVEDEGVGDGWGVRVRVRGGSG